MSDYIKREDVLEFSRIFVDQVWETGGYRNCTTVAVPVEKIEEIPSADVVEVRHGKWGKGNMPTYGGYKCSVCGENTLHYKANFCPNCGADMRSNAK